jgi:hypothetical protein
VGVYVLVEKPYDQWGDSCSVILTGAVGQVGVEVVAFRAPIVLMMIRVSERTMGYLLPRRTQLYGMLVGVNLRMAADHPPKTELQQALVHAAVKLGNFLEWPLVKVVEGQVPAV